MLFEKTKLRTHQLSLHLQTVADGLDFTQNTVCVVIIGNSPSTYVHSTSANINQ